jgi:CBS domain-containing protein
MMMTLSLEATPSLVLRARTARDLMTPNPVSLRADATLREAVALLTDKGYSAAPVIDAAGRPVGVLSRSDILVHDRETVAYANVPAFSTDEKPSTASGERLPAGFQVEVTDRTQVRDLMTPVVFAVAPDTPAADVVRQLLTLNVHRLFVVDDGKVLIGVISSQDVLRHLGPPEA